MALGESQRIINVIRQAIGQEVKSAARVQLVRGVVAVSNGNFVDLYLNGNELEVSQNFRVPAGIHLSVGDFVIAAVDYGSNLGKFIVEIIPKSTYAKKSFDPNTGIVYTSDGTSVPVAGGELGSGGGGGSSRAFAYFMGS